MTNESSIPASDTPTHVLLRDTEGSAYAVPVAVLEAHRLTPDQRAELEAQFREVAGYSAESAPPADADIFTLTPEELAPYRVSDEEREALEAQGAPFDTDVQGYWTGRFDLSRYHYMPTMVGYGGTTQNTGRFPVIFWTPEGWTTQAPQQGPYPGLR